MGVLRVGTRNFSVAELLGSVETAIPREARQGPVALVTADAVTAVSAAAFLSHEQRAGAVVPADRLSAAVDLLVNRGLTIVDLDRGAVLRRAESPATDVPEGTVFLLTSGSTGTPKLVAHTWQSLFTTNRVRVEEPANWWLTYLPGTYAWYQMVTMWLFLEGNHLSVCHGGTSSEALSLAIAADVDAISCTPSFFRLLLINCGPEACRNLSLRRLTFGGEPVDSAVLRDAKELFPHAVLTHIYASTEAGAAIVVRDGLAGFPESYLERVASSGIRIRVEDGVLWIHSPYASVESSEWINSGDLVEVVDGRVQFLGRADTAMISVGGAKVPARVVEACLLKHPDVFWCQVAARRAPILGSVVAAQIVLRPGVTRTNLEIETELTTHCRAELPEVMCPRIFTVLESVPVTDAFKTVVSQGTSVSHE